MSEVDPAKIGEVAVTEPVISLTQKPKPREEALSEVREWGISLLKPTLIIIRVTLIIILAILADNLIIVVISWSFGSIVSHNAFAAKLLVGIQLLSALGTAVAYILYIIRALLRDVQETKDTVKVNKK